MFEKDPKKPDSSNVVSGSSSTSPAPPDAAQVARDAQRTLRIYLVEKGDNLSTISKKFYGNANSWKRIFDANRDQIRDADLIQPGWKLRIPE
jgi:nucleoid-associated protein YgaU